MKRAHNEEEKKSAMSMEHFGDPVEASNWLKSR
jgi:hypothetical protein